MFEAGPTYVGTTKYKLPQFSSIDSSYEFSICDFVSKADVNKPLSLRLMAILANQPAAGMDWYDASLTVDFMEKDYPA